MSMAFINCPAQTDLTESERTLLDGLPDAVHEISNKAVWCELNSRHSDSHEALAQPAHLDWWVRWDDTGGRELSAVDSSALQGVLASSR